MARLDIPQRIDLFEFHELEWVPYKLKVLFREVLSWEQEFSGTFQAFMPLLDKWLRGTGAEAILDLCSGAGGPGMVLKRELDAYGHTIKIKLTDLYPPVEVYEQICRDHEDVTYFDGPFDATNSHSDPGYPVRTLLTAFHHFSPELAVRILSDAVQNSNGIFIIDPFKRDLGHVAMVPPLITAGALLYPFRKPRPFNFLVSYMIPAIPAMFLWDSLASVLRGYTPGELSGMAKKADPTGLFDWESGSVDFLPGMSGVYLAGKRK